MFIEVCEWVQTNRIRCQGQFRKDVQKLHLLCHCRSHPNRFLMGQLGERNHVHVNCLVRSHAHRAVWLEGDYACIRQRSLFLAFRLRALFGDNFQVGVIRLRDFNPVDIVLSHRLIVFLRFFSRFSQFSSFHF